MQRFSDAEQALIDVWEAHTAAEFDHKDADECYSERDASGFHDCF